MQVEARLRAFSAVSRHGSFSRAARELFISQPAVSKHVASLERQLGTALVVRARRGATLTPAGRQLADHVLRAEALLANAERAVAAAAGATFGTLSLVASGIPGTYLLPGVLARFVQAHPDVELAFETTTSGPAIEAVRAHRAELGVVGGFPAPPDLESESIVEDDILLVGTPALAARSLRVRDLAELTWIYREEGSATRAAVEVACWEIGLNVRQRLELPSWEAVKLAVASGAGIAACSRFALDLELRAGTLAVLRVRGWKLKRLISAVHAREIPLTPPADAFLKLLRAEFEAKPRPTRRPRPS